MIRERILELIDLSRPGLEIGALDKPCVSRALGPVEYVDRASRDDLLKEYAGHPIDHAAIVEVDHVWIDQPLVEAVGGKRTYAYVLASHVIEHAPDLFGWLRQIAEVLDAGGIAAFTVPDRRYTFDRLRRTSSFAEMAEAYVRKVRKPTARQIFDHVWYARNDPETEPPPEATTSERAQEILGFCQHIHDVDSYIDVHCWVFTPQSIVAALDLGSRLGVLPFAIERVEPTEPGTIEFLLALKRLPDALDREGQRAAFEASLAGIDLPTEDGDLTARLDSLEAQASTLAARASAAEAAARAQSERALAAEARAVSAEARIQALEASTSWRLTAPVRATIDALRRGRHAG